jgi:hypothetical protein
VDRPESAQRHRLATWYIASLYAFAAVALFVGMVTVNNWWSARGLPIERGTVVAGAPRHQPCCGPLCRLLTTQVARPRPGWPARFEWEDCGRGGPAVGDAVRVARSPEGTVVDPFESVIDALLPPAAVLVGAALVVTAVFLLARRRKPLRRT